MDASTRSRVALAPDSAALGQKTLAAQSYLESSHNFSDKSYFELNICPVVKFRLTFLTSPKA